MKIPATLWLIPFLFLTSCLEREEISDPEKGGATQEEAPGEPEVEPEKPSDDDFIGLPLEQAQALAEKREMPHRVITVDGESLPATADYRPNRVSFDVEDGKVTKVTRG